MEKVWIKSQIEWDDSLPSMKHIIHVFSRSLSIISFSHKKKKNFNSFNIQAADENENNLSNENK